MAPTRSSLLLLGLAAAADAQSGQCGRTAADPCALDGSSSTYSEAIAGQRVITAAGCPNNNPVHVCVGDNPSPANTQGYTFSVPHTPQLNAATYEASLSNALSLSEVGGLIGMTVDGNSVLSCYGGATYGPCTDYASSATNAEGDTFTQCAGHGSPYHYHTAPTCLLQQMGPRSDGASPQVGWAADGFPIYGNRGPGGVLIKACGETGADATYCADSCGGYYGTDYADDFKYRYFLMGAENDFTTSPLSNLPGPEYFPFSPLCLLGCGATSIASTSGDRNPRIGDLLPACTGTASAGTAYGYTATALDGVTAPYAPVDQAWTWNGITDDSDRVTEPVVATRAAHAHPSSMPVLALVTAATVAALFLTN